MTSATLSAGRRGAPRSPGAFVDGIGDVRQLELLRIAIGPIVILHLWPFLTRSLEGIAYSDRFSAPYVAWYPEAPRELYFALLWLAVVSAVALSAGAATRLAAAYTAAFVTYNLFLSQLHLSHNRVFLCVLLIGLALTRVGRRHSVDALLRRRTGKSPLEAEARLWPILLMRFEIVVVFVASGWSKLIDPDWWGGTVLMIRFADGREMAEASGVPGWLLDVFVAEGFNSGFAKLAVLTELAIGLGLVFRRTRLGALWLEVGFHVAIEIIFSVQVFSYVALAAMVVWITPSARDRAVIVSGATAQTRLIRLAVRWLDWTGRFVLRSEASAGAPVTLVDREGRATSGRTATSFVLTRLPATFPLAAPFYAVSRVADTIRSGRGRRAPA